MSTMALGITLAATPRCRTGTPVSKRIRSGSHDGQVASWRAIPVVNQTCGRPTVVVTGSANRSKKRSIPWETEMVQWGSLNDLLGHQKEANRPSSWLKNSLLVLLVQGSKVKALSNGSIHSSKWTALNVGLTLHGWYKPKEAQRSLALLVLVLIAKQIWKYQGSITRAKCIGSLIFK